MGKETPRKRLKSATDGFVKLKLLTHTNLLIHLHPEKKQLRLKTVTKDKISNQVP